jgi:hypothetical protein
MPLGSCRWTTPEAKSRLGFPVVLWPNSIGGWRFTRCPNHTSDCFRSEVGTSKNASDVVTLRGQCFRHVKGGFKSGVQHLLPSKVRRCRAHRQEDINNSSLKTA